MVGRLTRPLAAAGIVAPLLFTTLVVVQGIWQPDYSHVAMPVSALAAWPAGWLQNLNFFVTGTLLAAFAAGLHAAIQPTRFGWVAAGLLVAGGAGVFASGLFPWISVNGVPTETRPHVVAAVVTFACSSVGLIVLSRRLAADPRWRDLSAYVLSTGIVMFLLFIVVGFFAIEPGAPLHAWTGLVQRVLVVVWFACLLVMAGRALRIARGRR